MQPPNTKDYWRNRRVMTWLAVLMGLFGFPCLVWLQPSMQVLALPVYGLVSAMVMAYMGTAVLDDKWQKEKP